MAVRGARTFAAAGLLAWLGNACTCSSSVLDAVVQVDAVEPAVGPQGVSTDAQILGEGFRVPITVDLSGQAVESGEITVTLGGVPLTEVVLQDTTRIDAVIPGTLPVGSHEVVIATSDGTEAQMGAALFALYGNDVGAVLAFVPSSLEKARCRRGKWKT